MKVFVRRIDDTKSVSFTEISFEEIDGLLAVVNSLGGFYDHRTGDLLPYHRHHFLLCDDEAILEIEVGTELE